MVGTGKAAEYGILIKSAESLENLHFVSTVVLDKTGTITNGKPQVVDTVCQTEEARLWQIAGSLEQNSEHPLAKAILEKVNNDQVELFKVEEFENIPGRGVRGKIGGKLYFGGNRALLEENGVSMEEIESKIQPFLEQGKTVLYFADDTTVMGAICVADEIKPSSFQAIQELRKRNIEIVMLTGDNAKVAENIAQKLKINQVVSEVLPQDKAREVQRLQKEGKKVAFVGDGINDSPALMQADIGLAIGSRTDIAIDSADVVLMKNDVNDVVSAIDLSKAVVQNIKMNLFWAFFYNIIGIPIAAGIFYLPLGLQLNPMIGAAAMSFSSVCVVINALRLTKFQSTRKEKEACPLPQKKGENMKQVILIEGMQCNHCKMTVEKALQAIEGVTKVEVSLEEKKATIEIAKEIEKSEIQKVIEEVGFTVR